MSIEFHAIGGKRRGHDAVGRLVNTSNLRPQDVSRYHCCSDFITEYKSYMEEICPFMTEEYLRATSMFLISAILGNNIRTSSYTGYGGGMKPHLMLLLLGPSSRPRKSVTIDYMRRFLKDTEVIHFYAESFSVEALYAELAQHRSGLMIKDEFVTIIDESKSKSYLGEIRQIFMKLGDGDLGKRHTKKDGITDASDIAPCFISASVPDFLSKRIYTSDITSGFLPRFLMYFTEGKSIKYRDRNLTEEQIARYRMLVNTLKFIYHTFHDLGGGQVVAEFDDDALDLIGEWSSNNEEDAIKSIKEEEQACYLKLNGFLYKFAIIHECCQPSSRERIVDDGGRKTINISIESVRKAIVEMDYYKNEVLPKSLERLSTKEEQLILNLIKKLKLKLEVEWIPHSRILRLSHMSSRELDRIIETLYLSEYLEVKSEKSENGTRRQRFYRVAKE